jgi:hypothetical protein
MNPSGLHVKVADRVLRLTLATRQQVGNHLAGWFQFQPLLARIIRDEPDLLDQYREPLSRDGSPEFQLMLNVLSGK